MFHYQESIQDSNGVAQNNWSVDLCAADADPIVAPAVAIYSNRAGTTAISGNRVKATDKGYIDFYVNPGRYTRRYYNAAGVYQYAILDSDMVADLSASTGAALVGFRQSGTGATARTAQDKLRERVSVKDFGAVGDGTTDDTAAIQAALTAAANVYFPAGTYLTSSTLVVNTGSQTLTGDGGHATKSVIKGGHTSGPILQVKQRSPTITGLAFTSTSSRYAAATATGHGILMGGDDAVSPAIITRQWLNDVYIFQQPTDGLHSRYGCELSEYHEVTVQDCKRHGYVFDDGTTGGMTNKGTAPFHWTLFNCRALECGGNALVAGNPGQTNSPIDLYALNFEALGCAWDATARLVDYNIYIIVNGARFVLLDCEDQQYASSTTAGGSPRTARATPTQGVFCAGNRYTFDFPYFSSLVTSVTFSGNTAAHRVNNPRIFAGTYAVNQSISFTIPSTTVDFQGYFSSVACTGSTKLVQCQSLTSRYFIDGVQYLGTTLTATDFKIVPDNVADVFTVTAGVAPEITSNLAQIEAQSDTAPIDTVDRIAFNSGFPPGQIVRIVAKTGETITYNNAVGNSGSAKGMDLNAATRVVTDTKELWLTYSSKSDRWKEISFF
jgi:hypothetical protein